MNVLLKIIRAVWLFFENIAIVVCGFFLKLILREKYTKKTENALRQFIRFCAIGLSNTLISLAVYYIMLFVFGDWVYLIASAAGFIISLFNAYFWNHKFVFNKGSRSHFSGFIRMGLAYIPGFVLSIAIPYVLVDILGVSPVISPLLTVVITTPVNFLINKLWAFGK
jgi:putative flippase GtrA